MRPIKITDILISGLIIFVVFKLLFYIDFEIITPFILPNDPCYYHTNDIPLWVDVFYMSGGSNGHPEGNLTHIIVVLILSIFLGLKLKKQIGKLLPPHQKSFS